MSMKVNDTQPYIYIILKITTTMLNLLESQAETLSKNPSKLLPLTYSLLSTAAKQHHPHNQLIPAQYMRQLLEVFTERSLTESNLDAANQLLAANCISVLLRANFSQLSHNKLYAATLLQYTNILQKLTQKINQTGLSPITRYFKYAARGVILSAIIFKLLERTHSFLPQYYRFARSVLDKIYEISQSNQITEEDNLPKITTEFLTRLCFSKNATKGNLACLLKSVWDQVNKLSSICSHSAHISIIEEIKTKFQTIKNTLPHNLQVLLTDIQEPVDQNKNVNIFLEQPIKVRQLTPRFYNEEQTFVLAKLRQKKTKLKKKIQNDLKRGVLVKQQESQIHEEVRRDKIKRQQKKQLFVIEKQTAQARKYHRIDQKVKLIRKGAKGENRKDGRGKQGIKGIKSTRSAKPASKHHIGMAKNKKGK